MYDDTENLFVSLLSEASYLPQKSNVPQILMRFFEKQKIPYKVYERDGIKNLVSQTSSNNHQVILNGHWDTVLPGKSFEPFKKVIVKNNMVSGLGACDMKGGCVALIEAFVACYKQKIPGVVLCLVGDEELGGENGTKLLLENNITAENIILGEPSNLQITLGQKANIFMEITSKGKSAHGAYPHRGENAIKNMNYIMTELLKLVESQEEISKPEALFKAMTINFGQINGGSAKNVIPDSCMLGLDIRLNPDTKHAEIINTVTEIAKKFNGVISFTHTAYGWQLKQDSDLLKAGVKALKDIKGSAKTIYKMGTNDGGLYAHFSNNGCNIINIGPGDSTLSHTTKEIVSLQDIHSAAEIYLKIIKQL